MAQLEERVAKIEGTLSQMSERLNHIETRSSQSNRCEVQPARVKAKPA